MLSFHREHWVGCMLRHIRIAVWVLYYRRKHWKSNHGTTVLPFGFSIKNVLVNFQIGLANLLHLLGSRQRHVSLATFLATIPDKTICRMQLDMPYIVKNSHCWSLFVLKRSFQIMKEVCILINHLYKSNHVIDFRRSL